MRPTVATPLCAIALSRIASDARAAAASESWRSRIGVEPACAAWPTNVIRWRSTPTVPLTADARRAPSRSTGPCSMCSSRYATAPSSRPAAALAPSRSMPHAARPSASVTPLESSRPRTSSVTSLRAQAEDPTRLRPNRAPSSSAQSTNRTPIGGVTPERFSWRTVSSAVISPSAPSSQPPSGTASMCDPTIRNSSRSPAMGAHKLPASSRSGSRPDSVSFAVSHARASHPLRRPGQPLGAGEPSTALRRQLVEVGDDRLRVEPYGAHATACRARPSVRGTKRPCPGSVLISPRS